MRRLQFILFGLMSGIIASTYFIVHFKTERSLITRTNEIAHSYNIHSWQDFVPWSSKEKKKKIIYNRVGKCGSRSMIQIMTTLASKHNFIVIGSTNYKILHIDLRKQVEFVTFIDELQAPFIYHHHIHYIDFLRFGALQPVYINLIRDPLSRLVSSYYYLRFGDHREGHRSWHFKGTEEEKNQTFDECVLNERPECTSPSRLFYIIPYFCGVEPSCRQPSQQALNQAKINVIKNYLVVGITSEFEDFLSVLEKLLPEFFTGALEIYKQPGDDLKSRMTTTKTANKKGPSAEVVEIMRKRLRLEYEFYDFVKDRFHRIKHEVLEKQRR